MIELSESTKKKLEQILEKAAKDISFREQLLTNPDEALGDFNLTPEELKLVGEMRRVNLEEIGVDVRRFRAILRDNGAKPNWITLGIVSRTPPRLSEAGRTRINSVLDRAVADIEFRQLLLTDPGSALADSSLTEGERMLLVAMHQESLEEWGIELGKLGSILPDARRVSPLHWAIADRLLKE